VAALVIAGIRPRNGVVQVWLITGLCAALAGVCVAWWWSWRRWRARLAREGADRHVAAFVATVERAEQQRALVWVAGVARAALEEHEEALAAEREGLDWLLWAAEVGDEG
jgi:short subunit dehydrogenase-like uncharacterized protein